MNKIKAIISNKVFLILLSFLLTTLSLKFIGEIGWIFMLYPVFIVLKGMLYGFILNPLREHRDLKRYLSYKGILTGTVKCNGEPVYGAKVAINNPLYKFDIDASKYHIFTDKNGKFEIPHVKDGELICVAYNNGYEFYSQKFTMTNSQKVNIDIELKSIKN
jgi:hypothetical protein